MEATITTIGDIFKQKVRDTEFNAYEAPTIWVEHDTGIEHEDYEHTYIESRDRIIYSSWKGGQHDVSYVDLLNPYRGDPFPNNPCLFIDGYIKQIGSHVIYCGALCASYTNSYPCLDNVADVFKYARNLEYVNQTFYGQSNIDRDYDLPEDLFWNCPKLKAVTSFIRTINKVPEGLFAKCPKLESVREAFRGTTITKIPVNLFKNNPNITDFINAFSLSAVTEIPDNLFSTVREPLIDGDIHVTGFASYTPLSNKFLKEEAPKTEEEREAKRNMYLPSDLPREVQWELISELRGYPAETF